MLKISNPHTATGEGEGRGTLVMCFLSLCCALVFCVRGASAQNADPANDIPLIAAPEPLPAIPVPAQPVLAPPAAPQAATPVAVQPVLAPSADPQAATPVAVQPVLAPSADPQAATPVAVQPALAPPADPQAATPVAVQPALAPPADPQAAIPAPIQPVLAPPAAQQAATPVAAQPALIPPVVPQGVSSAAEQPAIAMPATTQPTLPSMEKPIASAATAVATPDSTIVKVLPKYADDILPKSLFLSDDAYLQISNAIADYKKSLSPQDEKDKNIAQNSTSPDGSPSSATDKTDKDSKSKTTASSRGAVDIGTTFPQFYMESLVYHSPEDWVVRVNGQRITPETPAYKADVVVVAIDSDKVLLRWRPFNMGRVNDVWDSLPASKVDTKSEDQNAPAQLVFNNKKILDKVPDVPVLVDKDRGEVVFILRPNQTFSSFVMRALEGKVLSVPFPTGQKPTKSDEQKSIKVDEKKSEFNTGNDSDTGLNGLMKTVDKQSKDSKELKDPKEFQEVK